MCTVEDKDIYSLYYLVAVTSIMNICIKLTDSIQKKVRCILAKKTGKKLKLSTIYSYPEKKHIDQFTRAGTK